MAYFIYIKKQTHFIPLYFFKMANFQRGINDFITPKGSYTHNYNIADNEMDTLMI